MSGVVAVVGSGAAGLQAALAAARNDVEVVLITDRALGASNSVLAQGGMQYPADAASERSLRDDMLRAAGGPLDHGRLDDFVGGIRAMVAELVDAGLELDRDAAGLLQRRLAGGMSEPRVVTAGDRIGAPVMRLLLAAVRASDIEIAEHESVQAIGGGAGTGPVVATDRRELQAGAVVVATGGGSWARAQASGVASSNPKNANHVLQTALVDAGLATVDAEIYQYQPFGDVRSLDDSGVGKLIPESIASTGVRLLDSRGHEIISPLAGRLAVTEAIEATISSGGGISSDDGRTGVLLTMSDVAVDWLEQHYPTLTRRLRSRGDLGEDLIVSPFVHYQLGGLAVRARGATAVPGLFLAGEITGGLHGRNRLMGNGLTDALVHGRIAGSAAAASIKGG